MTIVLANGQLATAYLAINFTKTHISHPEGQVLIYWSIFHGVSKFLFFQSAKICCCLTRNYIVLIGLPFSSTFTLNSLWLIREFQKSFFTHRFIMIFKKEKNDLPLFIFITY